MKSHKLIIIWLVYLITASISILSADARMVRGEFTLINDLQEDVSRELSSRIGQELGLRKTRHDGLIGILAPQHDNSLMFGGRQYGYESWVQDGESEFEIVEFIRLGYLFFINDERYAELSPQLRSDLGVNVILVKNLAESILADPQKSEYTQTTIAAMLNSDLSGKRVIDAGSGEGLLSIVASRLGAQFVELIEIESDLLDKARVNLELNGLREGFDYNLIYEDLSETLEIYNQLTETDLITVVVANIGKWGVYSATNQDAIRLLSLIPNATIFIAGGYHTLLNNRAIRQDQKMICKMGFRVSSDIATIGDGIGKFVAWIATKKEII